MHKGPLSGVRVVEMSVFVAAPVTARLLADMGAEVIKVEAPAGDSWRPAGIGYLPRFNEDENPVFDIYNTGKKFVSLNVKAPEGKEAFFKLLDEADVFVTNLRPAALKRLGISYDDIKDRYPSLIYEPHRDEIGLYPSHKTRSEERSKHRRDIAYGRLHR